MRLNVFDNFIEEQYSKGLIDNMYPNEKGNVMVCCPFIHHNDTLNMDYHETKPSASINKEMGAFNCFVCGRHGNELEFAQMLTGLSKEDIIKGHLVEEELINDYSDWEQLQHKDLLNDFDMLLKLNDLNITAKTIKDVKLGKVINKLATPVFVEGKLKNVARYNINKLSNTPKVEYMPHSKTGDIVPYDLWYQNPANTVICEGEKDMLVARSYGMNAITLTGGSQSLLQPWYLDKIKGANVYIVYDNDDAGRNGAKKLYKQLVDYCNVFITDISIVCKEDKEDVSDFFNKYKKSREDFIYLLEHNSRQLTQNELNEVKTKGTLSFSKLSDNIKNSIIKKEVRSSLQIIATCLDTYAVPEYAVFKLKDGVEVENKKKNVSWFLKDSSGNFLELMEGKIKTKDIPDILASICKLPKKWYEVYNLELGKDRTIYKCVVTDEVKDNEEEKTNETTIDLYSFLPLEIGNNYDLSYKLFPHPREGQKLIAIATQIKQTDYNFDKNNREYLDHLDKFKVTNDIMTKINELYESARCYISPHSHYLDKNMWFMMDLVFNSPLDITYNGKIRGALDIFILGDTRTGKSEASKNLTKLYDFGEVVPLKTATSASLIGGTDERLKRTKLGALPRHHKELVVLEEFSGAPVDFIKTLTEIRSSNIVKIYRVAGEVKAPCKLRMITISNPIAYGTNLSQLASYPNGIEPLNELIRSPEDIARYDAFMLITQRELIDPNKNRLREALKIDEACYKTKSKWVKSLKAENVVISPELGSYIFEQSLKLNEMFACGFPVFGSETNKKIARMSSALACMLCSTVDYENIIVTKEHVDVIVSFLINIYDNNVFRLKDFAEEEKSFSLVVDKDTQTLNEIYPKNVTLIDFLANNSRVGRNELVTISGLNKDNFVRVFNLLASRKFVKLDREQVIPTIKFRKTYRLINKDFNLYDMTNSANNESMFD